MRGTFDDQGRLFSYISPEQRVSARHPLRKIRELVREVLSELDRDFRKRYASTGRSSIPPEQLLRALRLQVFYGVRSERQLMEQLDDNLLDRWFVGLSPDDAVWDATTCTKHRERLQAGDMFNRFMEKLLNHKEVRPVLSDEHFSVDGTTIEAWASHQSFKPKHDQESDGENFHGTTRKNDTHASTTDPDSRLYRKSAGKESTLCYLGHATMENRNGLAVKGIVTQATGRAEREASEDMRAEHASATQRITAGMDKAYDVQEHVARLRAKNITPPGAQNDTHRRSAIDGRTTRHPGYARSQPCRKMIACILGWGTPHGTMRKTKLRGTDNVAAHFLLNLIGYNLIRIPKWLPGTA